MNKKYLLVFPGVGSEERKTNVMNIINKMKNDEIIDEFDIKIYCYDDSDWSEDDKESDLYEYLYEKDVVFSYMNKYITPKVVSNYKYIFFCLDDLIFENVNIMEMIDIMKQNNIDVCSPSLANDSKYSHKHMLTRNSDEFGRLVDFIELFFTCFTPNAYIDYYNLFTEDIMNNKNKWGWGYDIVYYPIYKKRMALLDSMSMKHTHKASSKDNIEAGKFEDKQNVLERYSEYGTGKGLTLDYLN